MLLNSAGRRSLRRSVRSGRDFCLFVRLSEKGLTGWWSAQRGSLRPAAPGGDLSGCGCDLVVVELEEVVGGGD